MTSRRTRIPSDLKFLLNERAVLCGLLRSSAQGCRLLEGELAKVEATAGSLRGQLAAIHAQQAKWRAETAAIDNVLQKSHPGASPDAAGSVSAWAGKYGRRGELKAAVHSIIRACPTGVSTGKLADTLAAQFQVPIATRQARIKLRQAVSAQLCRSKGAGLLRSQPGGKGRPTIWFWNTGPSGDDLMRLTQGASCDEVADAFRGEVGG